jgi:FAD/FMN-containing dehydrogenase
MSRDLAGALEKWRSLPDAPEILHADAAQDRFGRDTSGATRTLAAALRITGAEQLRHVMRIAAAHSVPVHPISTGNNWGYGSSLPAAEGCVLLDLSPMNRILDFDPGMGVVSVEPGVTQGMLSTWLDQNKHPFMVPVTGAGPHCSLLGNALERGYGVTPHADHFAAVTDLEAVLADGSVYRTALHEAGAPELARLFKWGIGAYSAGLFTQSGFGIVTRMSIMLVRRPEAVKVCLFSLADDSLLEEAVNRIHTLLGALPGTVGGLNLMNRHRVLAMAAPYPYKELGPDGLIPAQLVERLGRQYQVAPWTGFGTLYGTQRMVAAAQREIRDALKGIASRLMFLSPGNARTLSRLSALLPGPMKQRMGSTARTLANSLELVAGRPNETALPLAYWRSPQAQASKARDPARDGCGLLWYAPLVPMRGVSARAYVDMVRRVTRDHHMEPLVTFTSISDKLFDSTVPLLYDPTSERGRSDARACFDALLVAGREIGVFPYRVGVDAMPALAALQPQARAFHARLRDAIDPQRLISPGRYE